MGVIGLLTFGCAVEDVYLHDIEEAKLVFRFSVLECRRVLLEGSPHHTAHGGRTRDALLFGIEAQYLTLPLGEGETVLLLFGRGLFQCLNA